MQHEFGSSANVDDLLAPSSISPLFFMSPDHRIPTPSYRSPESNIQEISQFLSQPRVNETGSTTPIQGMTTVSLTPFPAFFDNEDSIDIENRLYRARLVLQYQQIADHYQLRLSQLQDAEREAETITLQYIKRRHANDDLYRLLNINPTENNFMNSVTPENPPISLLDDRFRLLTLADPPDEASPTSVLGFKDNRLGRKCSAVDDRRLNLPWSISVRSTGYLKIHQTGSSSSESNRNIRNRPSPPVMHQKVCMGGAGKMDAGEPEDHVDVDLYNQGMFKTELCNKWQETGECPYGDHCQFAHGMGELRPIIRHPRYKTELCRMVLTGNTCPYGHRCHFRHVITQQERLNPA